MSDLSVRLTKAMEFDEKLAEANKHKNDRDYFVPGAEFENLRLQPFLEVLIECVAVLEKIKPGYGLDITDNVEYRAKYWADIAIGFQQIASEARVKLQTLLDAKEGK